jgi:hypothetical protein
MQELRGCEPAHQGIDGYSPNEQALSGSVAWQRVESDADGRLIE